MASARSLKFGTTAQARCVTPTHMTAHELSQYQVKSSYNKANLAQFGSSEIKVKQMKQKIDELQSVVTQLVD